MSKVYESRALDEREAAGRPEFCMEQPPSFLKDLSRVTVAVLMMVFISFVVLNFVGQRVSVEGTSMHPMLENGDQLLVDKLTYRFQDPERYDVVVFSLKTDSNVYYIKRIIGMPGETVRIDEEGIWIDDKLLLEEFGAEPMKDAGIASEPITLGTDEYFVLGDNRNDSRDSRREEIGNVDREQLMGKAFVRIWPFSEAGVLEHQ